jgi:hypothetical protein
MAIRNTSTLILAFVLFLCSVNASVAKDLDKGWWVILGSFPTEPYQRMQSDLESVNAAAARCGVQAFNDFSSKFQGFKPGYNVFVLGAYASQARANSVASTVRRCFEEAYVKYGEYLGE